MKFFAQPGRLLLAILTRGNIKFLSIMCNEGDEERMIICIFSELDGQGSAGT